MYLLGLWSGIASSDTWHVIDIMGVPGNATKTGIGIECADCVITDLLCRLHQHWHAVSSTFPLRNGIDGFVHEHSEYFATATQMFALHSVKLFEDFS